MRILFRPLSVLVSTILALGSLLQAQSTTPAEGEVRDLHLRVVEGTSTSAATGNLTPETLSVAVTDGAGSPVPSASVLFRLPSEGVTGTFSDGSRVAVVYTGLDGRATVNNIRWGAPGNTVIRITAGKGNAHAGLLLEQTVGPLSRSVSAHDTHPVMAQPKSERVEAPIEISSATIPNSVPASAQPAKVEITNHPDHTTGAGPQRSKKWLWIGLGVAAAGGAAFALMNKGGTTTPSSGGSTGGTSIGTPTISIGHP